MFILNMRKKKNNGEEITMTVDDYLTLILEQLDQIASDALEMSSIDKNMYENEKEYQLALLAVAKKRVFECAEEYGLNKSTLKLIDKMKLDEYILDAVKVVTEQSKYKFIPIDSEEESESDEATEPTDEASDTMDDTTEDLNKAIENFYEE